MISLTSPVKTAAHRWPAGAKLAGLSVATVALFALDTPMAQALAALAVLVIYTLPGAAFFRYGLRRLRPLWPFVLVLAVWHGIAGTWDEGAMIGLRIFSAVALANLVTMTTTLDALMRVVRWLLSPLARLGVKLAAIELAVAMVIRFTPVLSQKGAMLVLAWRARSARRPGWRVIVPFLVLALDDADAVAEALRARGGM